jgi:protein SCO1/2
MIINRTAMMFAAVTSLVIFHTAFGIRTILDVCEFGVTTHAVFAEQTATDRVAQLSVNRLSEAKGSRHSDAFPDVSLTDQFGNEHAFLSDIVRDNIVCIVLFYTECQGSCPGTTQMMKRLRESVKDDFAGEPVKFVSISLDPENDTSDDLLNYAKDNGILEDGPEWLFCTGSFEDVESIRMALGLYDLDPVIDADRTQHAALITFGNDRYNRWTAMPAGLSFSDLSETFRRISGTSERQRFATRITRSVAIVDAAHAACEARCCSGETRDGGKSCCPKTAD